MTHEQFNRLVDELENTRVKTLKEKKRAGFWGFREKGGSNYRK